MQATNQTENRLKLPYSVHSITELKLLPLGHLQKPSTFGESVRLRLGILKRDILENWFPINFNRAEMKRKEMMVRPAPTRMSMASLVVRSRTTLANIAELADAAKREEEEAARREKNKV